MNSRPAQPLSAAKARAASVPMATAADARSPAPHADAVSPPRFSSELADAVARCWKDAAAPANWDITHDEFQAALERSAAKRFAAAPPATARDTNKIEAYLDTLHARDLAMAEYRPELYRAAHAIVGHSTQSDASARDLADSLYADLYGLRESAAGQRKSLFEYFHGRSKLTTWLHAVLSRRHVDEIRRTRENQPLETEAGEVIAEAEVPAAANAARSSLSSGLSAGHDPERANYLVALQAAFTVALSALDPRDRLRLAYYYADDRTLAEIGRLLGEHEATVSRKLERTRRQVRSRVEDRLRDGKKWSEAQISACLECARGEWPFDLTAHLRPMGSADTSGRASPIDTSAGARKI
jgi:RNA polymerase sigma factor (sigma-70 family)